MLYSKLWILCVIATACSAATTIEDLAELDLQYENLGYDNSIDGVYNSRITLTNYGITDIDTEDQDVNIYVCLIRLIVNSNTDGGVELRTNDGNVTAYHLDGCAHRLTFQPPFLLNQSASYEVNMTQQFWLVSYTDVMPNWYIQLGNGDPQIISATTRDQTEFVAPFTTEEQYLRSAADRIPPWTPEERLKRFRMSRDPVDETDALNRLVPSATNPFQASSDSNIGPFSDLSEIDVTFNKDDSLMRDAHTIEITSNGSVEITAASMQSFLLSQSTLQQLLERNEGMLPVGILRDNRPRLGYRGFSLDIARHFQNKDTIKRHIDLMWRYKLNTLHLHFTDDESWAVEIEGLPELTQYGTRQCFNMDECITYPQLGRDISEENLYLTKDDYVEIVMYAESKGITVIPEVDLPGHSTAAIHAMRIRYEQDPTAEDYRLHDPNDTTEYLTVQYFTQSAVNPCINSTYNFIQLVAETLISYHEDAGQPLGILHLGGDEVADAWKQSPICQDLLKKTGNTEGYLKRLMLERMGEIAYSLNISLAFWEDGLIDKDVPNTPYMKEELFNNDTDVYVYTWQTVWEWGGGSRPYNMANSGFKVIMAPATRFYFDHVQEPNPQERGYYWARRYTDLIRPFSFRFDNFYANINGVSTTGFPQTEEIECTVKAACPPLNKPENIVGAEATLFAETIFNQDHMDNNVWPRLLAAAERMWTARSWEKLDGEFPDGLTADFSSFREALEKYELPYLEEKGVKYHLSPPAFDVKENDDGTMTLSGFTGEFTTHKVWLRDGNSTTELQPSDTYTYKTDQVLYFSTSNEDESRYSYEIEFQRQKSEATTTEAPVTAAASTLSSLSIFSVALYFLSIMF